MNIQTLQDEIYEELLDEIGISDDDTLSQKQLLSKVKDAIREIRTTRDYPDSYTEDKSASDLNRYFSNIKGLARYDYNQIGAEGETSHSGNGESRTWKDRTELLIGVIPLARVY